MKIFKWDKVGDLYACLAGDHVGQFLMFIEKGEIGYGFLKIPTMENIWVSKEKFDFGLKQGIIEYVQRVPKYVRETSKVKFTDNKSIQNQEL